MGVDVDDLTDSLPHCPQRRVPTLDASGEVESVACAKAGVCGVTGVTGVLQWLQPVLE
jgi:hypothetical protein